MLELELRDFVVFRNSLPLCKPVTFSAHRGEIIRLTGDNGVGKTTLLLSIASIHKHWLGVRRFRSKDPSLKLQGPSPFPSLTLAEALSIAKDGPASDREDIIDRLALRGLVAKPMGLLSGGESQRCALALAVARAHSLLLLDEPFVGLDPFSSDLVKGLLNDTSLDRATILVEHKMSLGIGISKEVTIEPS